MKKLWEKKNSKKGFTLVELIVVLVILAILMAMLIPAMTGWITKAKEKQNDLTARSVYLAVQSAAAEALEKDSGLTIDNVTAVLDEYLNGIGVDATNIKIYTKDGAVNGIIAKIDGKDVPYPKDFKAADSTELTKSTTTPTT